VVKKALAGLPGVMVVQVHFSARRADVLYHSSQVTVEQMVQALGRYGYRAAPWVEP